MSHWAQFEEQIGYTFSRREHLETAFTHRSYLNEHRKECSEHNERLEFLGDAVLELVSTEFLFHRYPEKPEGDLTAYRAALVNTISLADSANTLGMNEYMRLSRGEARDAGRARNVILANALEALIGAIYLDGGMEPARRFITSTLLYKIDTIIEKRLWQDPKSRFQELAQEHHSTTPSYLVVEQSGPDHDKHFVVAACIGKERVALGDGRSKQDAEQAAAQKAITTKGW